MTAPILEPAHAVIDHPYIAAAAVAESASVFTCERQAAFLGNLQLFGNVRHACKAACVSAQTAYRLRRASPGFRLAWDAALLAARGHAEATLTDRAINGVEEAVFYHGEEIARRRRYDSRLLLAHLARLDRLEDRAEVSAMLGLLDACIEAMEQGADIDDVLAAGEGAENSSQDSVPTVPSAHDEAGEEDDADAALPPLERRLRAMEAARPGDAPALADQVDLEAEIGALEAAQLAAFEAGLARWWEAHASEGPGGEPGWGEGADDTSATRGKGVSLGLLWDKERDGNEQDGIGEGMEPCAAGRCGCGDGDGGTRAGGRERDRCLAVR